MKMKNMATIRDDDLYRTKDKKQNVFWRIYLTGKWKEEGHDDDDGVLFRFHTPSSTFTPKAANVK